MSVVQLVWFLVGVIIYRAARSIWRDRHAFRKVTGRYAGSVDLAAGPDQTAVMHLNCRCGRAVHLRGGLLDGDDVEIYEAKPPRLTLASGGTLQRYFRADLAGWDLAELEDGRPVYYAENLVKGDRWTSETTEWDA